MKVVVLYRQRSEVARRVEEFIRDLQHFHPQAKVAVEDLDTREGAATASLYDMMSQPAVLALQDDGQLIQSWQGESLPLLNEVAYYAQQ